MMLYYLLFFVPTLILAQVELTTLPIIDISALKSASESNFCQDAQEVGEKINEVSQTFGFFYISNHGVPQELQNEIADLSTQFFQLPTDIKYSIAMNKSGKAWRGYFGVGDEVTSGIPDQKEGIYFGTELPSDDPRPLHGPNIWLETDFGNHYKEVVVSYMNEMKTLGRLLMKAIACSLQITDDYFLDQFNHPTELFRIFNYPPHDSSKFPDNSMGVGEHTDYGYLTLLKLDQAGGLQVRSLANSSLWINAPPVEGTYVINLGDALEHNTQGLYRATPHRVLKRVNATSQRISMPYFFDPNFDSQMRSMVPYFGPNVKKYSLHADKADRLAVRWDKFDPSLFDGTYGQYLLRKVSKAFPDLFQQFVDPISSN